jgi:hypothetical protein
MLRPPRFLAAQLARPTGVFGRYVMSPFLNRMNAAQATRTGLEVAGEPGSTPGQHLAIPDARQLLRY